MKPPDATLRKRYREAAAALRTTEGQLLYQQDIAKKLKAPPRTVRSFFERNPEFKQELGVRSAFVVHSLAEYKAAIEAVLACGVSRVKCSAVAALLGINTSSAAKFVRARPELQQMMRIRPRPRRTYKGEIFVPKPKVKKITQVSLS